MKRRMRRGRDWTHRFRGLDEDLALSQLVLVIVHIDRVQQMQHPLPLLPTPLRPGLLRQDCVPEEEHKKQNNV